MPGKSSKSTTKSATRRAAAKPAKTGSTPRPLARLRKICLSFPESLEVEAWGSPTFRLKNKLFAMFAHAVDLHGGGRHGVWIKCTKVNQQLLINSDRDRYFSPPYVGPSGWIGVYLDDKPDWKSVQELLYDGYLSIAPAKLRASLRGE